MDEAVPYGVVHSLLKNLASLADSYFGYNYGLVNELNVLRSTVELYHALLLDADKRQHRDHVKHWIRKVKYVLYDADSFFDELFIEDMQRMVNSNRGQVRDFFSSKNQLIFRPKVARRIEIIQKLLNDLDVERQRLSIVEGLVTSEEVEGFPRETTSFVDSQIIGRDESKNEIIEFLKRADTDQNVSLTAIVGMGGLGKTALAQLVYNEAKEQHLFQKYIWVCVSDDSDVKRVLQRILESLYHSAIDYLELVYIQKKLQEELIGQRYLLVLDDIWNEDRLKWDALRCHLMCGGEGSKILVTTRSMIVAQTMGINEPYYLKALTEEQSWNLFSKLMFGGYDGIINPDLVDIGRRITEKCAGIPLAIKTMAAFLKSRSEVSDWRSILESDVWLSGESIMSALKLSYQNMPSLLKPCFVYCSLYPKDWIFDKDELIQSWMAQGYLNDSDGRLSMEDMGNQYIKMLLMGSFFQEVSMNKSSDKVQFKMNALICDLAKSIAGDDYYLASKEAADFRRPMHISFVSASGVQSLASLDASKLRTVLGPKAKGQLVDIPPIIKDLKYVRVLDLSCSSITNLPKSIDKLKHLRYLDLSFCKELISLPESFENLVCLQTLKLRWCKKLVAGVEVVTKLISLRHLDIEHCKAFEDMMPAGLGKRTLLQSLPRYILGDDKNRNSGNLNELEHLDNIRGGMRICNLGLVKDVESESHEANLKAKAYIQQLELYWGDGEYHWEVKNKNSNSLLLLDNLCPHQNLQKLTVHGYPGIKFSSWLPSLINIVEINLLHLVDCQHLPPLERLPCLKTLQIRNMKELKFMHYEEISEVFFPSLETLLIYDCKNLRGWHSLVDVNNANDINNHLLLPPFPRLSSLQIQSCPKLTCMPTFPFVVKLELGLCSVKPMIDTCLAQHQPSSFYPLSQLKYLDIGEDMDTQELPMEWMKNLTSLEHLSVSGSTFIAAVSQNLPHA